MATITAFAAIATGAPLLTENPAAPAAAPSVTMRSVIARSPMRRMRGWRCTWARSVRETAGPVDRKST